MEPYASRPLPVEGCFNTKVWANGQEVNATFFRYSENKCKRTFTTNGWGIAQPTPQQDEQTTSDPYGIFRHGQTPEPLSKAKDYVTQFRQQKANGESPRRQIVNKHPKLFQGIGKHKYREVELISDKSVKFKVHVQRRIPFLKKQKFEEIIQELEEGHIIEQLIGLTEWISNVVLTSKGDPTQLRMNIDMTLDDTNTRWTGHETGIHATGANTWVQIYDNLLYSSRSSTF